MSFGSFMAGPWGPLLAMMGTGILGNVLSPYDRDMKRARERYLYEMSPTAIGRNADEFFNISLNSPGMAMARTQAIQAGQTGQAALGRHLGQTGIGRSGVGASMSAAVGAAPGIHMATMTADAWQRALMMASQNAQMRAQGQTLFTKPGMGRSMTAAALNAGIPYLMSMGGQKQPGPPERGINPPGQYGPQQDFNYNPYDEDALGPPQKNWWEAGAAPWGYPR